MSVDIVREQVGRLDPKAQLKREVNGAGESPKMEDDAGEAPMDIEVEETEPERSPMEQQTNLKAEERDMLDVNPKLETQQATAAENLSVFTNGHDPNVLNAEPSIFSETELKLEPTPSKMSRSFSHDSDDGDHPERIASSSKSPFARSFSGSPTPKKSGSLFPKKGESRHRDDVQLINHLPRVDEDALNTFDVLPENTFERKSLGRSHQQEEMMICDCVFNPGRDDPQDACGIHSNCINRLTQVECLADECPTGRFCLNQRFTRKQYAKVEIVLTEKKGYGLRAGSDIQAETFIYEYIGEVVTQSSFMKRMKDYADEGIQHFYFMMLQREEYIDATKKGGIARFANHSCNPNCYVAKWVVGKRMRMGIFAKRDVQRGEELTFNYNVDRYGHNAQACYCGEPNCVGTIGGKTQTDIGGMDDLFLDALGITDEVEEQELRGTRKKKSRKLDEDFIVSPLSESTQSMIADKNAIQPKLRPIRDEEVPKVVAGLRQSTSSHKIMTKLLDRINMTSDENVQKRLMVTHGYSLMWSVLNEQREDAEIARLVLSVLERWRPSKRNKIVDSRIEEPVRACAETSEDPAVRESAEKLLDSWSRLELEWRLPRKIRVSDAEDDGQEIVPIIQTSRPAWEPEVKTSHFELAPLRRPPRFTPRPPPPPSLPISTPTTPVTKAPVIDGDRLEQILQMARSNQVEAVSSPIEKRPSEPGTPESSHKRIRLEDKEKQLTKMFSKEVVEMMSKYKRHMDRDTFKSFAKECTALLVEKEKRRNPNWQSLKSLDSKMHAKIEQFVKDFAKKALKKVEAKRRRHAADLSPHSHLDDYDSEPMMGRSVDTVEGGDSPAVATPDFISSSANVLVSNGTPFSPGQTGK